MNLEEFIASLPQSIATGYRAPLPDTVIRKILTFAQVGKRDAFYHLYCGDGRAVLIAATEFGVRESVGVEPEPSLAQSASTRCSTISAARIINSDPSAVDLSNATVVFAWLTEPGSAPRMERKIKKELLAGGRVITIWSPFALTIPNKIDFPFFVTKKPFQRARSIRDQFKAIYGNTCIDFTAAWLLAERYIDQLETVPVEHRRFVTILQSLVIWINAWKMRVACEGEIPPPVQTYVGILKTFFDVDLSNFIEGQ